MHAPSFIQHRFQPHPDLRASWGEHYVLFTPSLALQQHIDACSNEVRRNPDHRDYAYARLFPLIDAVVRHLRQAGPPEAQWLTLYSIAASPTGWLLYWGFPGLQEAFQGDLICAIPDSPDKPLPVTRENCHLHNVPADDEAIREANKRLGKQWRGCISGLWSRRTTAAGCNPTTGLLRLDLDDGTLTQAQGILRQLEERGFAFICTPSFSAREGKHKCHIFVHDEQQVSHEVISAHYAHLARHVLGEDHWHLYDASQGRATQLTYLTAVARRLSDPLFAMVVHPGQTSWISALQHVPDVRRSEPTGGRPIGGRREHRERSHEADVIEAAWPHPVCPAIIATCDRHRLALVASLRLSSCRQMSDLQRLGYLEQLARNIRLVCPHSTHTFAWLVKQLRSDQNTTFSC